MGVWHRTRLPARGDTKASTGVAALDAAGKGQRKNRPCSEEKRPHAAGREGPRWPGVLPRW